jgi:hypothetical protein
MHRAQQMCAVLPNERSRLDRPVKHLSGPGKPLSGEANTVLDYNLPDSGHQGMNTLLDNERLVGSSSSRKPRWLPRAILAGAVLLGLSGCLLNRASVVKEQFCDFDNNFSMVFDDRTQFIIHDPVLLDSDILWLTGSQPTSVSVRGEQLRMGFEIEKVLPQPDPATDMEISLYFDQVDGEFRLRQVQLDENLSTFLNPELLESEMMTSAIQNVCSAGLSVASMRQELDISQREIDLLPSRTEMFEQFGAPTEIIETGRGYAYEYRVRSADVSRQAEAGDTARVEVWFDDEGSMPLRVQSRYSRYETRADFVARKMQFRFRL